MALRNGGAITYGPKYTSAEKTNFGNGLENHCLKNLWFADDFRGNRS